MMNAYRTLPRAASRLLAPRGTPQLPCRCSQLRSLSSKAHSTVPGGRPIDRTRNRKRSDDSLAAEVKKFNRLAVAAAVSMLVTGGIVYFSNYTSSGSTKETASASGWSFWKPLKAEAPNGVEEKFQGKTVLVAAGGAKLLAHDDKSGEDIELVPTGTSSIPHFPKVINLPRPGQANDEDTEYTLVGLGIRTVSFLSIQVYVVGLYVQTTSLHEVQSRFIKRVNQLATTLIPGEKEELKKALLDPAESYAIWDEILKDTNSHINSAFRIVPTRNTDFQHLRDGWVRGITARTQAASTKGDKQFSDESFGVSMREFNALFGGKGKAPKGNVIVLTRDGDGKFGVLYQEKTNKPEHFGVIRDERIARLIWLGYLGGKGVSSEDTRKNIVDGIIDLVSRPVGTIVARVT